jgi:hypothetical protein
MTGERKTLTLRAFQAFLPLPTGEGKESPLLPRVSANRKKGERIR